MLISLLENRNSDTKKLHQIPFKRRINEQKLLSNLSADTYKAMDVYISSLLNVVTDLNKKEIRDVIDIGIKKAKSCSKQDFYNFYSKIFHDIMRKRKLIKSNNRENYYAEIISKMLENRLNFNLEHNYLDIGCGNCKITKMVANKININPKLVFGIDLLESQQFGKIKRYSFDGQKIPKEIPNADIVTIFQVLHHIKTQNEAKKLLNSVYKNMNDKAYLVIREHEVKKLQDKKFWKFIHDFQCKIIGTASKNLDNGTLYLSSEKWENILNQIGFKMVDKKYDINYNDKQSYFLLLQK